MSAHERSRISRAGLLGLATLSLVSCTAETPESTGAAEQAAINQLPGNLNLTLNAKGSVTIGPFAQVFGDVGSSGIKGSVLFDVSSQQGFNNNALATTVTVRTNASVGHVLGNDLTVDGFATQQSLGLDPMALPQIPAATAATPSTTNVTVATNNAKQLCPGQYGVISLGAHATLNLNGGVYQLSRLTLADGARLEPSEPVVILVSGNLSTSTGAVIQPSVQSINPMSAGDIRIEIGGSVTLGDSTHVRAHLLVPNGKLTTGKLTNLIGAAWAKTISIGAQSSVVGEGVFSAQAPSVPPPCNDNNACTADVCVGGGAAVAFCRNTPVPTGTSCEDGNTCNGVELCNSAGQCAPGAPVSAGTSCSDNDACNGDETCNGLGSCVPGTPLVVSDGNACTTDTCDPAAGVSHASLPDGTTCSGVGTCEAGTCSVQGTVFSEAFLQFQSPSAAQCEHWNDFRDNELVDGSYGSVTISGTFDPAGVTCSDPTAASQICQALHHGDFSSVSCGGHTWNIGACGGIVLSLDTNICSCSFGAGDAVRPCLFNENWGGVNTQTCDAPSQNITVVCE